VFSGYGLRIQGLRVRVSFVGFGVLCLGSRVLGSSLTVIGFGAHEFAFLGVGCRVKCSGVNRFAGFRVQRSKRVERFRG
jgi:hypothetical protein